MIWTKRGHEFDELGSYIAKTDEIYLFGAGIHGKTVYEKYHDKIRIKGFIDNDLAKQGAEFCGLPVFSPEIIEQFAKETVVLTVQPSSVRVITEQLTGMGYSGNLYPMQLFFPVFDSYRYGESCLSSISFIPTTACNLMCKCCLNFSPYIKKHRVRPLEHLMQDMELLFSKVDTLLLLHISGGEPLLHPYLHELVVFILQGFREKLGRLEITTNGTVLPSDLLLAAFSDEQVHLVVDDYRDALPQYREKYDLLIEKLDECGVSYQVLKADSWLDLTACDISIEGFDEIRLRSHFNACDVPWQEYRDGKLWICNYASYADFAGKQAAEPDESYDIKSLDFDNHRELMEFRLGFSSKGYTEFCKQCAGYFNNTHTVPVAEQL